MRICIVTARFPPDRCGVGDYSHFLACALHSAGQEVDVLTGVGRSNQVLNPLPSPVRVHRVITDWGVRGLGHCISHIRHIEPDVLLLQYAPTSFDPRGITFAPNVIPALLRSSPPGIRVIANLHELYVPFYNSVRGTAQALWQRVSLLMLASMSHAISVTSREWRRRLRRSGIRKPVAVIPVGSNIPLAASNSLGRNGIRTRLLGRSEGLLLAGFGAMHDRDVPGILYALRKVREIAPARLVWIGGGLPTRQYKEAIDLAMRDNNLTDDDVVWTGVQPHQEVSQLLRACDIMVLPYGDGISTRRTTAIAALQHRLPLITTQGTHSERIFLHRRNVYMVPVADQDALAEGVRELANDVDLRLRIASGGRDLYERMFDWDVVASRVTHFSEAR